MHWLLQNNYVQALTGRVAIALRERERPFQDFSVVPGRELAPFDVAPEAPHFFYGSTGLVQRLQALARWRSSLFLDELSLDQRHWQDQRGADMLNPHFDVCTLEALMQTPPREDVFVRPVVLQKAFTGQVVRNGDLSPLFIDRRGVRREPVPDMLVACAPVRDIRAEYRCLIYRGEVVAASRYRLDNALSVSAEVPRGMASGFAELARGWLPSELTVMDVALLGPDELRIVEFNSVHSSGLYAIDTGCFIDTVEHAVSQRKRSSHRQ